MQKYCKQTEEYDGSPFYIYHTLRISHHPLLANQSHNRKQNINCYFTTFHILSILNNIYYT